MVLGIFDGVLMAYDSQFLQLLGALSENKGCHIYCYNEKSYTVIVGSRKKLFLYSWQSPGFAFQRDFNLIDVPKSLCALQSAVVVGYKKFYECINLQSSFVSRVLDIDRECRMATIEVRL